VRNIRGVRFECDFTLDPRVGDMFFSAYEPDEVAVLDRYLGPGDVFVDVGANIGYLTAIGASRVGPAGEVLSFEPVLDYYLRLKALRDANPSYRIRIHQVALGEREGTSEIVQSAPGNIGWNTMVPGLLADHIQARHDVQVQRLDDCLARYGIAHVALMKIDAEGYELPILRGASGFLESTKTLPPILCEVAPGAYPFLGAQVSELFEYMADLSYAPFEVATPRRSLDGTSLTTTTNVLFLPQPR